MVPLPMSDQLLFTCTLAKAATVAPLLAKVTLYEPIKNEPNADPLLIATVPSLIVVPPV
jgi:hypothetical protein